MVWTDLNVFEDLEKKKLIISCKLKCFFPPVIALCAWLGTGPASEVYSK